MTGSSSRYPVRLPGNAVSKAAPEVAPGCLALWRRRRARIPGQRVVAFFYCLTPKTAQTIAHDSDFANPFR